MAILVALLRETLNGDVMELTLGLAKNMALSEGVSEKEFERVEKKIREFWAIRRAQNPLSILFM